MTTTTPPGYDIGDEHNITPATTTPSATTAAAGDVPPNPAGIPLPMSPGAQDPRHGTTNLFADSMILTGPDHTSTSPPSLTTPVSFEPPSLPPPHLAGNVQQAQEAPHLPERPRETHVTFAEDPKIASLQAMFPDFDAETLQNILDSVGGDQDRAIDALLSMTDPDYVSTQGPQEEEPARPRSQTELDEDFARQLMLEEEDLHRREQVRQQGRMQEAQRDQHNWWPQTDSDRWRQQNQGGVPPPAQRDTMADVQEQFTKIAETGKRTFSSIVSKVKAKVQEFDQQRNSGQSSGTQPSWGAQSYGGSQPGPDRHSQQAYYAPNNAPYGSSRQSESNEVRSYSNVPPGTYDSSVPSSTTPIGTQPTPANNAAGYNLTDSGATPPPPGTNSGNPIDTGRIGLLPKRPVSLVGREAPPATQQAATRDDESEELEYMENPFEEDTHRR